MSFLFEYRRHKAGIMLRSGKTTNKPCLRFSDSLYALRMRFHASFTQTHFVVKFTFYSLLLFKPLWKYN